MTNHIAYLVDPKTCTISEVRAEKGIDWIYKALQCDMFCGGYSAESSLPTLFLDDNGLYAEERHFFQYRGAYDPFVNRGLAMDTDGEGESVSPAISIEEFAKAVEFIVPMKINGHIMWVQNVLPVTINKLPKVTA